MQSLVAEQLTKDFGEGQARVRAVAGVDLQVSSGEVVLIMGPSGSGKTTLLFLLGALLRPTSGRVRVDGEDVAAAPSRRLPAIRLRHFGFVFQDFNLLANLTARENVEVVLNLAGVRGVDARRRSGRLLKGLGLGKRADHLPEKLSGGEKQRVAIARALANHPPAILADEPTANLDRENGRQVARLLRDAAHGQGAAVVMVSHDARVVEFADRVLRMEDGRITDAGASPRGMEPARGLPSSPGGERMMKDPVCGMMVDEKSAKHTSSHGGRTFYFCSPGCKRTFDQDPPRYRH